MIIGIHTFFHSEDVMHDTTSVGQGRSSNEDQLYIDYHQDDEMDTYDPATPWMKRQTKMVATF